MPGALRGEEGRHLYGLPGLNEKDQLKVDVANQLSVYLLQLCKYAHRRRVPFYIENPLTSRLWKMPEMKQLMSLTHSDTVELDLCQYGEKWRKSTRPLVSRHPDLRSVGKLCCFGRGFLEFPAMHQGRVFSGLRKLRHTLDGSAGRWLALSGSTLLRGG